ncbi:hypothetical protein [Chitiniphilus eburneus]|uniref:Uncharacterized protein n=1 Tax=Chitiniphilus eburneus TaxID=2571148 RepID=A0A4V5MR94_9NEIS|nr:hypothetical protein [Chitiniphilus eburneus]TJZ75598.1 hypothetical protein FAZ21_06705 [Chitiniphilus eburneus]
MTTDRELLELAAKAAGRIGCYLECPMTDLVGISDGGSDSGLWNPLRDNGDALALMAQLELHSSPEFSHFLKLERCLSRKAVGCATYRRAIVSVAAAFGRAIP